ncbi:MAG: low temperature requirement protein A [Phaeodactylibacter sp.]|nr:low temperature requirement protein A [Phaeodactylibacter sp.]MCB9273034.1 low temperature requirement protein A [Lewinellaceae bacterium]
MPFRKSASAWWGPPRKFDMPEESRRVSWLELFYDLVYVIAIARITHHLSAHFNLESFLEYMVLFILIFWGWLNGSLYHDLHGNDGLRTRLMTLWQMMIIAALSITLDHLPGQGYANLTIVFMAMQLYITYLWWSVGFYDRSHRRYNLPYTILYLISLILMGLSLVLPSSWLKLIIPLVLICNYAPPFISQALLRQGDVDLDLSSSMFERLGLLTIIVFGEVVIGVVNGIGGIRELGLSAWLNFALALSIVFALWWIFFTLISRREPKGGFLNATLLELLYIPALISLGLAAVSFTSFFLEQHNSYSPETLFGYAVAIFLACISLMMWLLELPDRFRRLHRHIRVSLLLTALVFLSATLAHLEVGVFTFLLGALAILLVEMIYLNSLYYKLMN